MTMTPTIADRSRAFANSLEADDDQPGIPMHIRWESALSRWPRLAQRRLDEDMTAIYREGYEAGTFGLVFAAHDLALMQCRFLSQLMYLGVGMKHIVGYHLSNAVLWRNKLNDRLEHIAPDLTEDELDSIETTLSEGEEIEGVELIEDDEGESIGVAQIPDPLKKLVERTPHGWMH